jgi:hypothetical protein
MDMHIVVVLARLVCDLLILAAFGVAAVYLVRRGVEGLLGLRGKSRGELVKIAGFVALGPITGPLAARVLSYSRRGRPLMAAAWALAIPLAWAGVASAATVLAHALGH